MTAKKYRASLSERLRNARIAKGYTQAQVGDWLGIGRASYQKHEERGSLPPYLFEHFAIITDIDPLFLLTGHTADIKLAANR